MKPASITDLENDIVQPGIEKHLVPVALYRGNTTLGAVQRKWNFAISMMHSEVEDFGEAVKFSNHQEFSHLCEPRTNIQFRTMYSFLSRLKDQPRVTDNVRGLTSYVKFMLPKGGCKLIQVPLIDQGRTTRVPWREWREKQKPGPRLGFRHSVTAADCFYPYVIHKPKVQDDAYTLMLLVNKAVPPGLPDHIRADICQDMILGVLSGEIEREDLEHNVKDYSRKVFEMHPLKYGHLSLDSPLGDEDGRTLMDVLGN